MIKTVYLTGLSIQKIDAPKIYQHAFVENNANDMIYISKNSNVSPGNDGVLAIAPSESKLYINLNSDEVYVSTTGSGEIEIQFTNLANANFRKYLKGGERLRNALKDNLNITADANINSIVTAVEDSKYQIKNLSTIEGTISCGKLAIIDGKLFLLPNSINVGTIEVRDYQTNNLLKTINDGTNAATTSICFDDDYIYISKVIETITDKKYRDVYIRKYNRCTLDFVSESPVLYTGITGLTVTNASNIFAMIENGEYLYLACVRNTQIPEITHIIMKIKKSDFSLISTLTWQTPLNVIKHTNGFFTLGANELSGGVKRRRIDFLDWDLNITQTFPQTSLTNNGFRNGFYKDDFLYAGNDSGVLVKYQISTNTIVSETQISEAAVIYNILLINNDFLLLQTNTAKILLYDLALNFIKKWDFYKTTTGGGYMLGDNNNTIWTQSVSQPNTIYKKQFIDLST